MGSPTPYTESTRIPRIGANESPELSCIPKSRHGSKMTEFYTFPHTLHDFFFFFGVCACRTRDATGCTQARTNSGELPRGSVAPTSWTSAPTARIPSHRRKCLHGPTERGLSVGRHGVGLVQDDDLERRAWVPSLALAPPHRHLPGPTTACKTPATNPRPPSPVPARRNQIVSPSPHASECQAVFGSIEVESDTP